MRLRTADGQVFDAWVNSPENDRRIPKWLGQIGHTTDTHTTIQAPDGSLLTVGANDVIVNEHGRLVAMSMRNARRLFDIEEGEEELQGPQSISVPAQTLQVGRARQGMVTADRGRLQPDNPVARQLSNPSASDNAVAASDSGAAGSEQDGKLAGEPAATDPTQATATGGPGGEVADDPAFGATGDGGGEVTAGDHDEVDAGPDAEDSGEEVKPRRRSRK